MYRTSVVANRFINSTVILFFHPPSPSERPLKSSKCQESCCRTVIRHDVQAVKTSITLAKCLINLTCQVRFKILCVFGMMPCRSLGSSMWAVVWGEGGRVFFFWQKIDISYAPSCNAKYLYTELWDVMGGFPNGITYTSILTTLTTSQLPS